MGSPWWRRRRDDDADAPADHPVASAFPLSAARGVDAAGRPVRVSILSRHGCHLCEVAEGTVRTVCADLSTPAGVEVAYLEDHPGLTAEYGERVPVVFVDNRPHDYWRVDADRLRLALRA